MHVPILCTGEIKYEILRYKEINFYLLIPKHRLRNSPVSVCRCDTWICAFLRSMVMTFCPTETKEFWANKRVCFIFYFYLLTPWCRALLEKLTGLQLVNKFPAFYRTRRFITALTSVRHPSLSWTSPIQSTYPHPTSWRSIRILSTNLRLGLPSDLFPSGFLTKTIYAPSPHPYAPRAQPISSYILFWC